MGTAEPQVLFHFYEGMKISQVSVDWLQFPLWGIKNKGMWNCLLPVVSFNPCFPVAISKNVMTYLLQAQLVATSCFVVWCWGHTQALHTPGRGSASEQQPPP